MYLCANSVGGAKLNQHQDWSARGNQAEAIEGWHVETMLAEELSEAEG